MQKRGDVICSNLFVLSELLVGPAKIGDTSAAQKIERFFHSQIRLLPYDEASVRVFAELRARQGIKSLDAIHLATAAAAGVDAFVTNDRRLEKVAIPGISFILPMDSSAL